MSGHGPPAERSAHAGEAPAARFPTWVVGVALLVYAVALPKALVLDEESYLWLGRHVSWANPYDWTREWQGREGWGYAHPPLYLWWHKAWSAWESWVGGHPVSGHDPEGTMFVHWQPGPLWAVRLSALPWVLLWSGAAALWIRRTCHHPAVAGVAFLGSTTVVLGLQDSLMIDLPYVALTTAALAAYREGFPARSWRWHAAAGLALGLAIETKYPAALLAPVFVVHGLRAGFSAPFWACAAAVVGGVEGYLWATHGSPHPLAVWESREWVARGPLGARLLGTLARAALLPAAVALLYTRPVHAGVGLALGATALLAARPDALEAVPLLFLLGCAALGGAAFSRAVEGLLASPLRRRKGDQHDSLLLGGSVVVTFLGVVAVHNYASARYLLPAAAPLAILLGRAAEDVPHGKAAQLVASALGGALALALAAVDSSFATAGVDAARGALVAARSHGVTEGKFVAEWSARAELEAAGWRRLVDVETARPGERVIVMRQSGGRVPDAWEPLAVVEVPGPIPLRVLDVRAGIGLYAETLGPLPFGLSSGPLEVAVLYEVR